jgi:hypothetical protein
MPPAEHRGGGLMLDADAWHCVHCLPNDDTAVQRRTGEGAQRSSDCNAGLDGKHGGTSHTGSPVDAGLAPKPGNFSRS